MPYEEDFELEDDELEFDDEPAGDESVVDEDDEFGWVREAGADNVKKTWSQYTQTRQELADEKRQMEAMKRELEPYMKLKDDVLKDPGLVSLIDGYYKNGRPADLEIQDVKTQLAGLQAQLATERELTGVRQWIRENEYPDAEDQDILQYAVDNGIANLRAAYKDMMFEKVQDRKAQELENGIKRSRGAKSATSRKPSDKTPLKGLDKMDDEDFISNYSEILKRYAR